MADNANSRVVELAMDMIAMDTMFTIPQNIILYIVAGLVGAIVVFVIRGFIKGWDKVFPDIH